MPIEYPPDWLIEPPTLNKYLQKREHYYLPSKILKLLGTYKMVKMGDDFLAFAETLKERKEVLLDQTNHEEIKYIGEMIQEISIKQKLNRINRIADI